MDSDIECFGWNLEGDQFCREQKAVRSTILFKKKKKEFTHFNCGGNYDNVEDSLNFTLRIVPIKINQPSYLIIIL
jgi:hypothetical protein